MSQIHGCRGLLTLWWLPFNHRHGRGCCNAGGTLGSQQLIRRGLENVATVILSLSFFFQEFLSIFRNFFFLFIASKLPIKLLITIRVKFELIKSYLLI